MRKTIFISWLMVFPIFLWAQKSERDLSSEHWTFKKVNDNKWLPAKVPGTVHTDLLANKIIPDPFFGANEKQLQWIEKEDWQYQTTFTVSESEIKHKHCILQFEGLDTYAQVSLNGNKILTADNMFRTWKVDVKDLLKTGKNKLEITFESAVRNAKNEAGKLKYTLPGDEKVFVRKAQYQFGWDWGPRFVTAGIWKKPTLQFYDTAVLNNVRFELKSIKDNYARLQFVTEVSSDTDGIFSLKLNDKTQTATIKKGRCIILMNYEISNAKLWWCNGLGTPTLYPFELHLLDENGKELDSKKMNIGLRTIELVQDKDNIGRSFYFKLNGVPVFMKGANVIPPDSFLPKATASTYQQIIKNAIAGNMNMLRVWGGGVYGDDAFYDACDKNGILVWQDFMFACSMYPGDPDFLENVREEVKDNVTRLQNHPSLALWCGNNENDEGWHNWGWQKQYNYTKEDSTKIWKDYQKLFHELIPQTLSTILSPNENRYWSSSPSIGWGKKESLLSGDSHYWGVWWGMEPFEVYQQKVGRFMSEFGFQGMPDLKTFEAFAPKNELHLESESVKTHQKHPTGYKTINEYMTRDYVIPIQFEDYIYVSQLLQAKGMKTAIEAHRMAKPNCMGSLFWQLNDCWPVTSWSSVDYYGRWKAFQYQAKRSFENILVLIKESKDVYEVYVTNDNLESYEGNFEIKLLDFKGETVWNTSLPAKISANSSSKYYEIPKHFNKEALKHQVLSVKFASGSKIFQSEYYFVNPKELQLTKPNIRISKIDELTYRITSDVLAKDVFLSADEDTFFSDNYFDLLPNQEHIIKLDKPIKQIKVKSLFDTLP